MNGLAICAGVGGLELGLSIAVKDYRTVCYIERESFSAATLVARMEGQSLDTAPIWDDLTTFDSKQWLGKVDIISAGFPCQPWSVAGAKKGTEDDRWLWPSIARIIREVEPNLVFLENVPGLLTGGLEHVLGDLAEMGFNAEWGCISAREVGASHKRERVFILAYSRSRSGSSRQGESRVLNQQGKKRIQGLDSGPSQSMANSVSKRSRRRSEGSEQSQIQGRRSSEDKTKGPSIGVADSNKQGRQRSEQCWEHCLEEGNRGHMGQLANYAIHSPQALKIMKDGEKSSKNTPKLNPLFVEWLMGWPQGWTAFEPVEMGSYLFRQRTLLENLLRE